VNYAVTPNAERSWLEKIANDPSSTQLERNEALAQLAEGSVVTQLDQDRLITRYLDREIEPEEYMRLPEATLDLFHALVYWPAGLISDQVDGYVEILVALHGRTLSQPLKNRCREAITQWRKLAIRYRQFAGSDKAARRATLFLETFPERTNHEQ
jgi:hypothetical protein